MESMNTFIPQVLLLELEYASEVFDPDGIEQALAYPSSADAGSQGTQRFPVPPPVPSKQKFVGTDFLAV
jgi:hypothetical protein